MSKSSAQRKISEMQLYPLAFHPSQNATSWVSLRTQHDDSIDYLVIQKPKSKTSFNQVASYFTLHSLPWHTFTIISVYLNYFLISYLYFFIRSKEIFTWPFYLITVFDAFYLLDVILAGTIYFNKKIRPNAVENPRNILLSIVDLFMSFPYSTVCLALDPNTKSFTFLFLRCITFMRMYRLIAYFNQCENSVTLYRWFIFFVKFVCYFSVILHCAIFLWYLLAYPIGQNAPGYWSRRLNDTNYYPKNTHEWYFISMYLSITGLTNCGFGDILPTNFREKIAAIVVMSTGIIIWSFYISCLTLLFLRRRIKKYKLQNQVESILKHLKFIRADDEITENIRNYYEMFWIKKSGVDKPQLEYIPGEINMQMSLYANCNLLRCSDVFKNKPEMYLRNLSHFFNHEFYLVGTNIFTENEFKSKMIIIKSGTIDILSEEDSETPMMSFGPGTCLGEISLIICLTAKVTVKAATYVEALVLYSKDFYRISINYPEIFIDVRTMFFKRIYRAVISDRENKNLLKDLKKILGGNPPVTVASNMYTQLLYLYTYEDAKDKLYRSFRSFPWILNRNTGAMLVWEIIIALSALVVLIFYPYYVSFKHRFPPWFETIADIIHVIFVIDIYVLLTTAVVKNGCALNSMKKILDERMDTFGFYLDVFAAFYIEVYAYLAEDVDRLYYLLKLNRLLKLYRISTLCDRFQDTLLPNTIVVPFVKYAVFVLAFAYCFGIFMYIETCYFDSCTYNGWFITKIYNDVQSRILTFDVHGKFLMSIYFGSSNTLSIGIGDILPTNMQDIMCVIGGILIGKLIFGYYLSEMAALLTLKLTNLRKMEEIIHVLNFYALCRSIPAKLEKRVIKYMDIQWQHNEAEYILHKKTLLHNAPEFLHCEILKEERFYTLRKVNIFSEFDDSFIKFLVLHSRMIIMTPNETVTYLGSINREMYVIYRGYCLQQTEKNIYKTIGPGCALGFPSLLFGLPSLSNIYTLSHSLMIYIDVKVFNLALLSSPGLFKLVYKTRQFILAKFHGNFEVKMIENPHYAVKKKMLKMKYKKLNQKIITNKSFLNTYKYCVYNGESYSKLSNKPSKICFLKYLLMPITILPSGPFLKCWIALRLVVTLVVVFGMPLQYIISPYRSELHYAMFILDIFAYVDIYLMFHVGYYGNTKQLIVHPWSTAEHYMKGSFVFDFIVWFPFAGLIKLMDSSHNEKHSDFAHSFSPHLFHCSVLLIKVLDVYRLPCAFNYLEEKLQRGKIFSFFKYVLYMLLLIHGWSIFVLANTCKYMHKMDLNYSDIAYNVTKVPGMIPVVTSDLNLFCRENTWLAKSRFRNYSTMMDVYVFAAYWTTSNMAWVGFGDVVAQNQKEVIMSLLMTATGVLYFGYILAKIISDDVSFQTTLLSYESKFLSLMYYLNQENVSTVLKTKIKHYIQYKWTRVRNYDVHGIISLLNPALHEDTMLHLYEDTLRHVPMFENMDHSFFRVFGKELREEYYLEGQTVLKINDIVDDIFIIHKGTVEVSSPFNTIPVVMGIGGVFGNVFKTNVSLCAIKVRAMRNLDVLCMNVITFRNMLKNYPFIQKKLAVFTQNDGHRHFAIPTSFVNASGSYMNPNIYWATRQAINLPNKKSFFGTCRNSFTWNLHIFNIFSCLTMMAAYLNCLLTTYQFSFQHFCNYLLIMAIIIDVIFLLKFCMEINSPYVSTPNDSNWYDRCLRCKWNRTLDFIANLPFSYSLLFVPFISDDNANFYFSIWRMVTMLRLYYILQFFQTHKNELITQRFCLDLCILFVSSTLICHWFACLWYMFICPFKICKDLSWSSNIKKDNPVEIYTTVLYFIVGIFTNTGTGDIILETTQQVAVVTFYMIISKIFLGYFIGQFITMLHCNATSLFKYEAVMKDIKTYFLNMGLKKKQLNHIWNYLCLLWKKKRGLQAPILFAELPKTIRIELTSEVYGQLLKDSYIFCQTEFDFIRQLTLYLKQTTYFPGNYIVRDGDADSSMYFIHYGDVEILTVNKSETVHEVLHKSEVFGIVQGLFKEIPHHFSFRALTIVDVVVLKLSEWEYLLDFFPKSKDVIYKRVEEIYHTI